MTKRGVRLPAALAVALIVGCGTSGGDRAGGAPGPKPRVLTLSNEFADSGNLDRFTHAVERLSGGTLRIEVKNWSIRGQAAREPGLINDVRARRADLGAAPARSSTASTSRAFARSRHRC